MWEIHFQMFTHGLLLSKWIIDSSAADQDNSECNVIALAKDVPSITSSLRNGSRDWLCSNKYWALLFRVDSNMSNSRMNIAHAFTQTSITFAVNARRVSLLSYATNLHLLDYEDKIYDFSSHYTNIDVTTFA